MLVEHHVQGQTVKRTKPKAEQASYGERYYGWNKAPPVLGGMPMGLGHRQGHYDMIREDYREFPPTLSAEQFLRYGRRQRSKLVPAYHKERYGHRQGHYDMIQEDYRKFFYIACLRLRARSLCVVRPVGRFHVVKSSLGVPLHT
jgi:uncharacterized protein affecting Mg2+/Co2+ transport